MYDFQTNSLMFPQSYQYKNYKLLLPEEGMQCISHFIDI